MGTICFMFIVHLETRKRQWHFEFGSVHMHMIMDSPHLDDSPFLLFWLIGNVCYQKELNGGAFQRVVNCGEEVSRLHIWI